MELWGVDPGVTEVFVASNSSDPRVYIDDSEMREEMILASPEQQQHQVRKFSSAEFYTLAGYRTTNRKIMEWKKQSGIDVIESRIASAKTSTTQGINEHIRTKLAVLDQLLLFYGQDFQQLRFLNYHGQQKATTEMVNIFIDGGMKYGPHPDHGNSHAVYERRIKPDGTKKRRRRKFQQSEQQPTTDQ